MQTCPQSSTPSGGSLEGRDAPGVTAALETGTSLTQAGSRRLAGRAGKTRCEYRAAAGAHLPPRPRPPATTARGKVRMSHPRLPGQHSRGAARSIQTPSRWLRRRRALSKAPRPCRGPRQARRPAGQRRVDAGPQGSAPRVHCSAAGTGSRRVSHICKRGAKHGSGARSVWTWAARYTAARGGSFLLPRPARVTGASISGTLPPRPSTTDSRASAPWFCR